jgi:hypothetical protein
MGPTASLFLETQVCSWLFSHSFACLYLTLFTPEIAETKNIADIAPSILKQLNQEQLAKLLAQAQQSSGAEQAASGDFKMPNLVDDE